MRTKTTLLSAALLAAGALSSMAQSSVYSLNVVGYVTVQIQPGYQILNNPLNDGNGNYLTNIMSGDNGSLMYTNLPDGTTLYPWAISGGAGSYGNLQQFIGTYGWYDGANPASVTNQIAPGSGFFLYAPSAASVTFVGNVIQGSASSPLSAGYTLTGSQFPLSIPLGQGGITAGPNDPTAPTLQLPANDGDTAYFYANNGTSSGYDLIQYIGTYGWYDPNYPGNGAGGTSDGSGGPTNGPSPSVAQGFFYFKGAAATWTDSFTVQ